MAALDRWQGRRVGILGFARSGRALATALLRAGAEPLVWDDRAAALAEARALGLRAGTDADLVTLSLLVASPGVPLHFPQPHPVIAAARAAGVPVTGDVQLFAACRPDLGLIGVTGSNGKSTTAALLHHLLTSAGEPALLGGNIGTPVFALEAPEGATVVLELSSFQLDLCDALDTKIAVWLNLSPDHLDRHGSLAGYIAAKRRLLDQQRDGGAIVIAVDDEISAALADEFEARGRRIVRVSGVRDNGVTVGIAGTTLIDRLDGSEQQVRLDTGARLRGAHNRQNIAAAWAAARLLGLPPDRLRQGLASFRGLPHRMEEIASIDGVLFVNDSKATNPDAAARSLSAFPCVFWIAGGRPKPGGFDALRPFVGGVRRGFFIGEAAAALAATFAADFPVECCGTLPVAVERAFAVARASREHAPVVLLAPACASFDQYRDFEQRGEHFRELVLALARRHASLEEELS